VRTPPGPQAAAGAEQPPLVIMPGVATYNVELTQRQILAQTAGDQGGPQF